MSAFSDWAGRHTIGLLIVALVAVICAFAGVVGIGALVTLVALATPVSSPIAAAAPWLLGALLLGVSAVVVALLLAWTTLTRVAGMRYRWLSAAAVRAERRSDLAARARLADRVTPPRTPAARKHELNALKRRYVEGGIDEYEFERRLDRLLDDSSRSRRDRPRGFERRHVEHAEHAEFEHER